MDLKLPDPPKNYEDLKKEILRWPRVGMQAPDQEAGGQGSGSLFSRQAPAYRQTGFRRNPDFNHIYKGIERDVDRLILEGYLVEFKHKDVLHEALRKKGGGIQPGRKEPETTLLYPTNIDANRDVEVRGSLSKYP